MTNSQLDTTNESQEVSPFPAGDHKAQINRRAQRHSKHTTEKKHNKTQKKYALERSVKHFTGGFNRFKGASTEHTDVWFAWKTPLRHQTIAHFEVICCSCKGFQYCVTSNVHHSMHLSYCLCFISFVYLNFYILGDDTSISQGYFMQTKHLFALIQTRNKDVVATVTLFQAKQ